MGIVDFPTSFNSSFFIRTFFPGFIASILYSFALAPISFGSSWESLEIEDKLIIWIVIGMMIGLIINSLDMYIYQFFEGINWPRKIWRYKYKNIINYFEKIDKKVKIIDEKIDDVLNNKESVDIDNIELEELIDEQSKLWAEIRKFPYNLDKKYYSDRYPEAATIFGNVLCEYESYPEKQYGMHMMVFWQPLWFILPKEIKEDFDLVAAKADFIVYLSFVFLTYSFIGGIGFYFQSYTWSNILNYNIPLYTIFTFIISIILCFLFYKISISNHKNYGRFIKAIFDIYRFDLAKKLKITISYAPNEDEIKKWRQYRNYLLDYIKINDTLNSEKTVENDFYYLV